MRKEKMLKGPVAEAVAPKIAPVEPSLPLKKTRQIVIETDGSSINLVSAEVAGNIELVAILENLIGFIKSKK